MIGKAFIHIFNLSFFSRQEGKQLDAVATFYSSPGIAVPIFCYSQTTISIEATKRIFVVKKKTIN
jgi:hypothetical protein